MLEIISLKQYPPNMSHIGRDVKLFGYCHGRHLQNDVAFLTAHSNSHPLCEYSLKSWNPAVSWRSLHPLVLRSKLLKSEVVSRILGMTCMVVWYPGLSWWREVFWSIKSFFPDIPIVYERWDGPNGWFVYGFMLTQNCKPIEYVYEIHCFFFAKLNNRC